ncbi:hypothetical protein AQUCO_00200997v1 [Aquilegia coerulea]|uniref:non-specific serine/threonine protein kinase n=1 Tax=Aquilegia coerulea TaxID=218851 RepID=A0A2G5F5Q8_AQUCA|nr:hypothetical protein AQUCO_00200997v1 [Aquilegia coerulea]
MTEITSELSGNFTAVSPDAEVMKRFTRLGKDVDLLSAEMIDVICLRDYARRRGQPQMDINWLNNVRAREGEVVELQKKCNEIQRGGGMNLKACRKLNKEVIVCLKAVVGLKREANHNVVAHRVADYAILEGSVLRNRDGSSTSRSVQTVLKHLAKTGTISFSPSELRSYTSSFSTILGSGGFGDVYKGQFPNGVLFAVKLLRKDLTDKIVSKQFLAEVGTMGRTYHRNLVRVYGYCFHESMKALVYEYMELGSLDDLLKDPKLEWRKMYNIVTDTAKGLSYLHENCHQRIIHLDIKPANVLIDSDFCSKVADYGLAKQYKWSLSHVTLTYIEGTRGYIAPELCLEYSFRGTSKCDVYSFGMLLFKVLESKKKSEKQRCIAAEVLKKFKEGELEEFLNDCGIEEIDREDAMKLVLVAICCIQYNPQDRPSMSTVVKTLEGEIPAKVPPNSLFPRMFSSSVALTTLAEENKNMLSSSYSSLGITRDEDYTTKGSTSFESSVSSETSPAFGEQVEIEEKNEENKDIKPEVKNDEVTTVVLKVNISCCEKCPQKVKKCLEKMEF